MTGGHIPKRRQCSTFLKNKYFHTNSGYLNLEVTTPFGVTWTSNGVTLL